MTAAVQLFTMQKNINTIIKIKLDLNKIDNIEFAIGMADYPDLCDSYIESADYNGIEMTDEELDYLHDNHSDWVAEKIWDYLH